MNLEFQDIETLLPVTRQKSGLLDFGGEILNFLSGTAHNANLQTLPQLVETIEGQQATITHSLEHQLTNTKELDESIRQNTRDVTLLARVLKMQINDLMRLNGKIRGIETNIMKRLELMANASQTV